MVVLEKQTSQDLRKSLKQMNVILYGMIMMKEAESFSETKVEHSIMISILKNRLKTCTFVFSCVCWQTGADCHRTYMESCDHGEVKQARLKMQRKSAFTVLHLLVAM